MWDIEKTAKILKGVARFSKHEALRFENYLFDPKNIRVLLVFVLLVSSFNYTVLVWLTEPEADPAPETTPTLSGTATGTKTPPRIPTRTFLPNNTQTTEPTPTITNTPPWKLMIDLYFASLPYPARKPASEWTVSEDGVKFVAFWEGYYTSPYNDGGDVGNCTIGYGQLLHLGPCDGSESGAVSQASAYAALQKSLNHCGSYIDDYVHVPLTQNQYNVMASLICNWGYPKFSQSQIVKLTNEGRFMEAGEVWKTTATCGINIGCGLPGLIRRRAMESYFFTSFDGTPMWPFKEQR